MYHPYRAAAHAFDYASALPNPAFRSPTPKRIPWHEVSARVLSIGMALEVPTAELDEVLAGIALAEAGRSHGSPVVDFAGRHGVSIDFLIGGDLLLLIAGVRAGRPVMFA